MPIVGVALTKGGGNFKRLLVMPQFHQRIALLP